MSIFAEEWRACLREQYKHVIRTEDTITWKSLVQVMHEVGFTEDELAYLRVEATMRAEDVPDDFVPELHLLEHPPALPDEMPFVPHPLECQCPACMELTLLPHDEDGHPVPQDSPDPDDEADSPHQLTMF